MKLLKDHWQWLPVIIFVAIVLPSVSFKFMSAPVTQHIFHTVGGFLGLEFFQSLGGYIIGALELLASLLLLIPSLRSYGSLLATGLMSGAVFFHFASPLGTSFTWYEDAMGQFVPAESVTGPTIALTEALADVAARQQGSIYHGTDTDLYILALVALAASLSLLAAHRRELLTLIGK